MDYMNYKIIQIIPAPDKMYAIYSDDSEQNGELKSKIVCLALIEYDDGTREVIPMDISEGDGIIEKLAGNLKCIVTD